MNILITIIQTKSNIQFVLTIQKVHRFLNNETGVNQFIFWNWLLVVAALGFYAIFFLYTFCVMLSFSYVWWIAGYALVVFDLNTIYVTQILKLLESKVHLWNIQALYSQEINRLGENYVKKI